MTAEPAATAPVDRPVFAGRIDILYALGRHYLSLPFAVLCVPATLFSGQPPSVLPLMPLVLQIAVVIAAEQLTQAYKHRHERPQGPGTPDYWARRYTFVSTIAGATWGVGALFWFVPNSFPAQAYLALAFLGMTATEFIARSAHRKAYLAHAATSLGPLVVLLLLHGGLYAVMTAVLVTFFGAVLYSYCNGMGRLLDEGLRLRFENAGLVVKLSREKEDAEAARDAAQASARAKSTFISNVSHELRTPMNALLGMAQLLDRAELGKPHRDHIKVMLEAGRGLQMLLDDVIALTRDDTSSLADEECDAVQTARAVSRLLQPRAWEKKLHLTVSAASDLPRVAADPRRVRQVLLKLTDNALKFTDRGGVDIRLERETRADGHECIRISVADTGHGVPPEMTPRLFKPFSPGDTSYTRSQQGAGLGLSVAKRVVEQAGGQIGFDSEPGAGAIFWFTLPVCGAVSYTETPTANNNAAPPPSNLSLLICTRDEATNTQIEHMTEPFGNRISAYTDVSGSIATAAQNSFDAIIVAAQDADSFAASPGVTAPIIALLGRGERAPAGATRVLRWPAPAETLYAALNEVASRDAQDAALATDADMGPAIDAHAFDALEKSVGMATLLEILQSYIKTAEQLSEALAGACSEEKWEDAARVAQDIAGAAGGLGLTAVTAAARGFAQKTRDGESRHELRNAAQIVVGEHMRARQALTHLYPDLVA
jgi:signal transduction histidine kinase/HPt (histidine-containing phosphotransfer) domain-containing protein